MIKTLITFQKARLIASVLFAFSQPNLNAQTPIEPTGLHHLLESANNTSTSFYWSDQSTNESGFVMERKYDAGNWEEVATIGSNTQSHNLTIADPNQRTTALRL